MDRMWMARCVSVFLCLAAACGTGDVASGPVLGTDEAGLSAGCAGLLPAVGAGVYVEQPIGTMGGCTAGTSDASGNIAFIGFGGADPELIVTLRDRATGAERARFRSGFFNDGSMNLFPQISGFMGATHPRSAMQKYDASGTRTGTSDAGSEMVGAIDYGGGALSVQRGTSESGDNAWFVQRFDSSANARHAPVLAHVMRGFNFPAAAVSLSGLSFLAMVDAPGPDGSPTILSFAWFDRTGRRVANGSIRVPAPVAASTAEPLLDGSVAVRVGGQWVARIAGASALGGPAPAWLSTRPGWDLALRPGNKGYALIEPGGKVRVDCAQNVEIHAPAGNNCGTVRFRSREGQCTGSGTTAQLMMGRDGTVVQHVPVNHSCGFGVCCARRFWPSALR
jgi:hypothetical protein